MSNYLERFAASAEKIAAALEAFVKRDCRHDNWSGSSSCGLYVIACQGCDLKIELNSTVIGWIAEFHGEITDATNH